MKPKPRESMHSATAPGSRSIRAPSASRTSADPQRPVAERLPCLATRQPAAAAMKAAVVETLNVGRPPPVPAVSTRGPSTSTLTASSRIVRASPAISATVSPFVRRPTRKAAVWASDALPAMISWSTRAASSALRSPPDATCSMASARTSLGIQEVAQQRLAVLGQYRLRVELNALGGQLAVAQGHHRAVRMRRDLEAVRDGGIDDERVIAAGHERGFEPPEDGPAVVLDSPGLAVHGLAPYHRA